tara:strand:- start:4656 stop:4802 length:147 start_codon:yes stop_codon:yes gene_type:complete
MICPECLGDGSLEVEEQTGGIDSNGPWVDYVSRIVECDKCSGWGVVDE